MHHRLSLWMALFAFVTLGALRAQTPGTAPAGTTSAMPPGQIVAKQVIGVVTMELNGARTELHNNDSVSQSAVITTQNQSSVVLVFSNGATTQLGADTTLSIDEFLQDPFKDELHVGALTEEPTRSRTKLSLRKGELLGKVAHLKHDEGSSFTVETPVGAAGIRGTTFRIVFRPTGTGQAFAFSLSTVEGNVNFQTGAPGQGTATAPGQVTPQPGTQPSGNGGVPVTSGQEVVVTVSVDVNQQTGQVTVSAPPTVTSTQPISVETQASLVQQAQNLATTAAATSFAPPPPLNSGNSGSSTSGNGDQGDANKSGGGSGGTTSSDTQSTTPATTDKQTTNPLQSNLGSAFGPASPGATQNLQDLTPGAGKGSQ